MKNPHDMTAAELDEMTRKIHERARQVLRLLDDAYPDRVLTAQSMATVIATVARNMGIPRENLIAMVGFAYDNFTQTPPSRQN